MRKWLLFTGFSLAIALSGAWWVWGRADDAAPANQTTQPSATPDASATPTPAATTTIKYSDQGFEPAAVTIKAGTTVKFVNNSSGPMWVASDEHPTHTQLSGFDAKRGLGPGSSYEFTFETTGSWGFHDHLQSSHTGTVVVE